MPARIAEVHRIAVAIRIRRLRQVRVPRDEPTEDRVVVPGAYLLVRVQTRRAVPVLPVAVRPVKAERTGRAARSPNTAPERIRLLRAGRRLAAVGFQLRRSLPVRQRVLARALRVRPLPHRVTREEEEFVAALGMVS